METLVNIIQGALIVGAIAFALYAVGLAATRYRHKDNMQGSELVLRGAAYVLIALFAAIVVTFLAFVGMLV